MDRRTFLGSSLAAVTVAGSTATTAVANTAAPSQPTVDPLEIQIGAGLIGPLYRRWKDKEFESIPIIAGIGLLRWRLAKESSVKMPLVRIRDNLKLAPHAYQILVHGQVIETGSVAESQLSNP